MRYAKRVMRMRPALNYPNARFRQEAVSGNPITIYVTVQTEGKSDDENSHKYQRYIPAKGIKPLTFDISFIEYKILVSERMITV
jgi:hypothetical protein